MKLFIKKYANQSLLPTFVVTFIFFVNYFFFGFENLTISVFATMSFLHFRNQVNFLGIMIKSLIIFMVIATFAYFAVMNIVLCIILNALVLFWIGYSFTNEYHPDGYYPPGVALIFFQMFRVNGFEGLINRYWAILASFIILFVFLAIMAHLKKSDPLKLFAMKGLSICKEIIKIIESNDVNELERKKTELMKINHQISTEIYMANRNAIGKDVKANQYSIFVAFFQVVYYFANGKISGIDNSEKLENTPYYCDLEMIKNLVNNLEAALLSDILITSTRRLNLRVGKISMRSFRLRFALRTSIILTICLTFAFASDLKSIYWLPLGVFYSMLPVYENIVKRVVLRVGGTIIGLMACFILFPIFNNFPTRVAILTIANFLIYSSSSDTLTMSSITCASLALDLSPKPLIMLGRVFIYNIIGGIISLTGNRFVFSIKIKKDISYIMDLLDEIRRGIPDLKNLEHSERKHRTNRLVLISYLLANRLDAYGNTLKKSDPDTDYSEYIKNHMVYITHYL